MADDCFDDLLDRAERAFVGQPVGEAFRGVRNIVGPAKLPDGEDQAQAAMDKLRAGEVPSPAEIAALETVIQALRPSLLSKRALFNPLPTYQHYEPGVVDQWNAFRNSAQPYLYSVGRIDRVDGNATTGLATGFVVAPGVLVTNTHVVQAISANSGVLQRGQAVVSFGQEYGVVPDPPAVAITGVIFIHPTLDISLLRIDDQTRPVWPVDDQPTSKGRRICVIGYPQDDPRSPVFRDVIFGDRFGVKRGAPGEVRRARPDTVLHDCSTLGGNSGSPLVDVETCKVVGVHRDGPLFLFRNEAVDGPSLAAVVNQRAH